MRKKIFIIQIPIHDKNFKTAEKIWIITKGSLSGTQNKLGR